MMIRHASILQSAQWVARGVFAAALLSACGQDSASTPTTPSASGDLSSAYESLSRSLQACEDAQDACTTTAAGDATKVKACDDQAAACKEKTKPAEDDARKHLCDAAKGCARGHHDDDGGVKGPGGEDMHHCVEQHAPKMPGPSCMKDLFDCLDKAGIRESSMQLSDAAKTAITTCAETAHTCFMTDMADRRHNGRGPGDHHEAGAGAPQGPGTGHHDGAAGDGPKGWAGAPAHHEAGGPARPASGGADAPRHHDEAGTDAHERAGAPAPRGNGGPGRRGEGGAGGGH
jgi:hypothetical protein